MKSLIELWLEMQIQRSMASLIIAINIVEDMKPPPDNFEITPSTFTGIIMAWEMNMVSHQGYE